MEEVGNEVGEDAIQERILEAIRARIRDFKEQADSITLENVRRIIEKDLGVELFTLDVHKRFIKQSLEKCLDAEDSAEDLSLQPETQENNEEEEFDPMHDKKSDEISEIINRADESCDTNAANKLNEATVKKALTKRAAYLRKNSEKLSLVEVRRILEADLELEKNALDPFKKFISQHLDKVLQPPETKTSVTVPKRRTVKGSSLPRVKRSTKADRKDGSEDLSSSDISRSDDEEINEPKKKSKKRSSLSSGRDKVVKKQKKSAKDIDHHMEDAESSSSDEGNIKHRKQTPAPTHGKRVEHLKSIIKSCGLGVPPSVYRKVKQAPESDRESYLIKELEDVLRKEGLSTNPSEKEIKAVRKKKERAKELEGIDLSNIVSSTRRRSASFVVPLKPEIRIESDSQEEEDDEEEEDEEEEEEEEEAEEENEGDDEIGNEYEEGEEEDEENNDSGEAEDDDDEESD